jgi:hypothetical protein
MTVPARKRLSAELPDKERDRLDELAAIEGVTVTDIVRKAIKVYDRVSAARTAGKVIVERAPDGTELELLVL